MPTRKQIEANRRNAQKSTGPVTAEGKAACAMNAFKTGLYAESLLIPGEKLEDLQQLIADYYREHRPTTPDQRGILDDLIMCEWQLRRLIVVEASLWNYQISEFFRPVEDEYRTGKALGNNTKSLSLIQRRIDATRRGRDRNIRLLEELTAKPIPRQPPAVTETPETPSPEIGSVPARPPKAPVEPPTEDPDDAETPLLPDAA